ncbi:MAG: four helix bundle protein [Candidatus Omnitrophica bacterium]|nr:four helix bundle protein [Candidatus Omnitrophota bacterium]MDD5574665.1 four helix bundle protein [Candidatus Omnitrophota bacterium]
MDIEKKRYKRLPVWQKADEMAYHVYVETKKFPAEELYGLTSQLRRAALSVPTNIVEGHAKQGKKVLKQFCNIALGSLAEVEYLLEFCLKVGLFNNSVYETLGSFRDEVGRLLWKFYRGL